MIATSSRISARAPVTAVSAPAKATAAAVSIRRSGNNRSSLVSSLRKLPRRAPRTSQVAARAAAGGKAYICNDCGWIYVPQVEGAAFESLDRFKCPVCSAPKRRFAPYSGAVGKGVNDLATRKARKTKLAGGGGGGKDAGNRRASGEGIDSGDASKLVAGLVGGLVIVGGLYFALNANF